MARYADRVNVMYAGRVVERSTARDLYAKPSHPYTLGLLGSMPRLDEARRGTPSRARPRGIPEGDTGLSPFPSPL